MFFPSFNVEQWFSTFFTLKDTCVASTWYTFLILYFLGIRHEIFWNISSWSAKKSLKNPCLLRVIVSLFELLLLQAGWCFLGCCFIISIFTYGKRQGRYRGSSFKPFLLQNQVNHLNFKMTERNRNIQIAFLYVEEVRVTSEKHIFAQILFGWLRSEKVSEICKMDH